MEVNALSALAETYKTISNAAEAEIVEKRSRFIAQAAAVPDEAAALQFIAQIKKRRYDARHNVYAFITGYAGEIVRQSDDGEPGGTGGLPVLNVLKSAGVTNTVIVVTRYFGGILLGAGGLARAYGRAAHDALSAGGIVEKRLCRRVCLEVPYTSAGKVRYELEKSGFVISEMIYAESPQMILFADDNSIALLTAVSADLTSGKAKIGLGDYVYV